MSYISEFNKDENNPRYVNTELKIEYHFAGFGIPLPEEKKRELIRLRGTPRRQSLLPVVIESPILTITLPDPGYEIQVILKTPDDQHSDAPTKP